MGVPPLGAKGPDEFRHGSGIRDLGLGFRE